LINIDVDINQSRIKKGRGLGMGLTLAPVMFITYVDEAIIESGVDKDTLSMYIDDLAMVLSNAIGKDAFVKLIDTFRKYDMEVNSNKCCLLTNDDIIKKSFSELGVVCKNSEKYLGVELCITKENCFTVDNRFFYIKKEFFCLPKVVNFIVKRLIYHAAVLAKLRYTSMMFSIKHISEKAQLLKLLWTLFKMDFPKLSYLQLTIFTLNYFRFFIDLYDIEIIIEESKKIKDIEERKKWANNYVVNRCLTGIEQLDPFIKEANVISNDPADWKVTMNKCHGISELMKQEIINKYIKIWKEEKIKEKKVIYNKIDVFVRSKFVINIKVIQLMVFHHYNENELDMNLFIMMVLVELNNRIVNNKDITNDYKIDFIAIPDNELRYGFFLRLYYNYRLKKVYELFDTLLDIDNKKEFKEIRKEAFKILCWLDNIYTTNRYKKKSINELLFVFNLKIALNLKLYDTLGEIIDKDNNLYGNANELDIDNIENCFSIDGSFSSETKSGGSGIVYKTIKDKEFKHVFFEVPHAFDNERNVAAELFATLWSLEKAVEMKLEEITIIFDYIGNYYYTNGLWIPKSNTISILVSRIRKVVQSSNLYIRWFKADSHTNISINDEADRLSKVGSGISKKDDIDIEVSPPRINA